MKEDHPYSVGLRPDRGGRGTGWGTQVLLAVLFGAGGGVVAVQITRHHTPPVSTMTFTQPDSSSRAHRPAVPYATAAALLTHAPSAHRQELVRLRNGNLMLVIAPVPHQHRPTPARPIRPTKR